jgi:hypothetical protein
MSTLRLSVLVFFKPYGRKGVFTRLDIYNQRVLHKKDFHIGLENVGVVINDEYQIDKIWSLLNFDGGDKISYRNFQTIISAEVN